MWKHSPQHSILWFCNIRAVKKNISIFDMYIPCEASSWTLLHQHRKLSSRISLQNQLFCLCRLPAVFFSTMIILQININHCLFIYFSLQPKIYFRFYLPVRFSEILNWKYNVVSRNVNFHNSYKYPTENPLDVILYLLIVTRQVW